MVPRLRLAYLDESADWAPDIIPVTGRIAGLYLYDAHQHVYCCEMTPSYALYLVGYLTERPVSETMQMLLLEATAEGQVSYMHAGRVDGFARLRRRPGRREIDPFVTGRMPCTITVPGPYARDHDQAVAAMLAFLGENGYTTT